jgi:alkanesulfonate monooxygenase SsuD/methylene tetrahydromethanopterin reductase-like flavin-dependent oxidoreductase (luciferase family)
MTLRFHWYLPTNGDGRDIVDGELGLATGVASTVPDVYFGGSSHEAGPVAARYSDVYLTWGEPPAAVNTKLRWMDSLARVSPNLWAGVGLLRGGAGTALVGSHAEVADRIEEYARLGLSEFILSGYPHLEEAYWFGEGVLPILQARGLWRHPVEAAGTLAPVSLSVN